jgi:hypoxanthine phosphoribosyltransferase
MTAAEVDAVRQTCHFPAASGHAGDTQSPVALADRPMRQAEPMADGSWYDADIDHVIISADQLRERIDELAQQVAADYGIPAGSHRPEGVAPGGPGLLLVCVLKGAVMFMADFARALGRTGPPAELEFMAMSSYGQGTTSSGVVRILKDLDRDIAGRHVLVVEDIVDSGLTLSWLLKYLDSRSPASVEVVALFRKPDAVKVTVPVKYVGFDIPNEFVVGYGLDFAERYREVPYVGVLKPEVYARS